MPPSMHLKKYSPSPGTEGLEKLLQHPHCAGFKPFCDRNVRTMLQIAVVQLEHALADAEMLPIAVKGVVTVDGGAIIQF